MPSKEHWDERACQAFADWHDRMVQKLDPQDFHYEAKNPRTNLERWGIMNRVMLHVGTAWVSEQVFSRLGSNPKAVHGDIAVTGSSQDLFVSDLFKHFSKHKNRILPEKRPMYARFIFATAAEYLTGFADKTTDNFRSNHIRLTARKMLLEGARISENESNSRIDPDWLKQTSGLVVNSRSHLPLIKEALTMFVDTPPL